MVPPKPTAIPRDASAKATPVSSAVAPEFCNSRDAPPSRRARMVPAEPTAQPWPGSGKATSLKVTPRSRPVVRARHSATTGDEVGVVRSVVVVDGTVVGTVATTVGADRVDVTGGP